MTPIGIIAALLALVLPVSDARAALDGSCTITVTRQGTMTTNAALNVLGSTQSGGQSALATANAQPGILGVLCTLLRPLNCFALSVNAPASFAAAPTGGGTGVGFSSVFRIDGSPVNQPEGAPVVILNGNHSVAVDLTATKSSGVFASGTYRAVVTLRCE